MEQFANNALSQLDGAISNSVTTLTVDSVSSFAASGNFQIKVDDEIMTVTAIAGNVFTVSRAQEGTSGVSHTDNTPVYGTITKKTLDNLRDEMFVRTAYASRPAAGRVGRLHLSTDGPYLGRDNGATWDNFGPIWPVTKPVVASYAWVNQGTALAVDSNAGIYISKPTTAGEDVKLMKKAAPATPYTITALMIPNFPPDDYAGMGLLFRESSSGKLVKNLFWVSSNKYYILQRYMNGPTSFNTDGAIVGLYPNTFVFLRIEDNGTNRIHYFSFDGVNWNAYSSESRTNFLTANEVGFCIWTIGRTAGATLVSWVEG